MPPLGLAEIRRAADTLMGVANRTPVQTSRTLDQISGARVFLKCESFQRVGAFKFRGAYNALSSLRSSITVQPAIALSSGNHAQGVALSASLLGLRAHIVMPEPVNPLKYQATLGYGATVHVVPAGENVEEVMKGLVDELNGIEIPAFNDERIISGQGTAMLEFLDSVPDLDAVLGPVGGGGLLSGTCLAGHGLVPAIKIYACEPRGALDAFYSVRENRIVPMTHPRTIAEGLRTSLGTLTLPILRDHLEDFFIVEEEEIIPAMRFAFERFKLIIEPASAVALAPLLRPEPVLAGKRVGVILSGGNVDLSAFFNTLSGSDGC